MNNEVKLLYEKLNAFACLKVLIENKETGYGLTKNLVLEMLLGFYENDNITIPLEGNINDITKKFHNQIEEKIKKYSDIEDLSYLRKDYRFNMPAETTIEEYNLLNFLNPEWKIKYLTSNASQNKRRKLFEKILIEDYILDDIYTAENYTPEAQEKIDVLRDQIQSNKYALSNLCAKLLEKDPKRLIEIQDKKILDFSGLKDRFGGTIVEETKIRLQQKANHYTRFNTCYALLKGDNYSKRSNAERKFDITCLLKSKCTYINPNRIVRLIDLDFEIDERFIKDLICVVKNYSRRYLEEKTTQFTYNDFRTKVAEALERKSLKAKSKEEFDTYMEYKKLFLEKTDYEKQQLDKLKKKIERDKQQLALLNGRLALTSILNTMNEKVKEGNYHFNKKVKNIDFKN